MATPPTRKSIAMTQSLYPLTFGIRLLVKLCMLTLVSCGGLTADAGSDTSTDWVRSCELDEQCSAEKKCHCDICTRQCEADADCRALSVSAVCIETPDECGQIGSVCVPDDSRAWLSSGSSQPPGDKPSECIDGPCTAGSACDPRMGCPRDSGGRLVCVADACEQTGTCSEVGPIGCDGNDAPVCGCDAQTYPNACTLHGAPMAHPGECSTEATMSDDESPACVAALDKAGCCLPVIAVTEAELQANPCLVNAAGADPREVWAELGSCAIPEPCPGAACAPVEHRADFALTTAVATEGGGCELSGACMDGPCVAGSGCDPRVGCPVGLKRAGMGEGALACVSEGCDLPGTCVEHALFGCGEISNPVCDCRGRTHTNECHLHGAPSDHVGPCDAD